MNTNTVNVERKQVPTAEPTTIGDFEVVVLTFDYATKPGSTFAGNATCVVKGLLPCDLGLGRISYFRPSEPSDPDDKGRAKFANFKDGDAWKPHIWFGDKNDRALHYRILGRARRAIQAWLAVHESPTAAFDALPQDIPVSRERVDDSDIPF
jgi:hypothetical protein